MSRGLAARAAAGLAAAVAVALAAAALGAGLAAGGTGGDGPSPSGVELRPIGEFEAPTYVTQAPGQPGTVYVVEQRGELRAMRNGRMLERPFLDLRDRVHYGPNQTPSVEAGMYSMAFDPRYEANRRFYVMYTGPGGANYVDSYKASAGPAVEAEPSSRRLVLKISHPYADSHNGGQLQIGPDGKLWISTGDCCCCGDPYDQARNLGTLLGKLLRIDPRPAHGGFRVPATNPLVGKPGPDPVYAWGLRNTWRFSFDRATGNLVLADVGDSDKPREEIDYLSPEAARGANFGWPEYEGFRLRDPDRPGPGTPLTPILSYSHHHGRCAITGGYVVRDPALPQLAGRYLYADFCGGRIRSLAPPPLNAAGLPPTGKVSDDRDEGLYLRSPVSFGEGLDGRIYVASQAGTVYRLQAAGAGGKGAVP